MKWKKVLAGVLALGVITGGVAGITNSATASQQGDGVSIDWENDIVWSDSYDYERTLWDKTERDVLAENVIVHHTTTIQGGGYEDVHQTHIEDKGWVTASYDFIIEEDGSIRLGSGLNTKQSSTSSTKDNLEIALTGNFEDSDEPTYAQYYSLAEIAEYVITFDGVVNHAEGRGEIIDTSNINSIQDFIGHNEVDPTACPGKDFSWNDFEYYYSQLSQSN